MTVHNFKAEMRKKEHEGLPFSSIFILQRKQTMRTIINWWNRRDKRSIPERVRTDWATGVLLLEARCVCELIASAFFIGWPYFHYAVGQGRIYDMLSKAFPVQMWGLCFLGSGVFVILSYATGHMTLRKVSSTAASALWGGVLLFMYSEQVPGWMIPLGTCVLLFELIRGIMLNHQSK